jgi:hypothetical protein
MGIFTYSGNEVRSITKICNNYKVKRAFRTRNTNSKLLKPTKEMNKYGNSGVYKLKFLTCQGLYIGQTGRNFKTRYKQHISEIGIIPQNLVMHNAYLIPAMNTGM